MKGGSQQMEKALNATLKEKTSEKSGKKYFVIEVQLTPNTIKQVFLEPTEVEVVKLYDQLTNKK